MGAPLNPVPGVLKIVLGGFVDNLAQNVWRNIIHARYSGTEPNNQTCANLADLFAQVWGTHMAPECPSQTSLQETTVTDLTSDTAGEGSSLRIIAGTRGDDAIPANACVLISYPSQIRFRGGHPRTYLYCGGNADLQGATEWASLFVNEAQTHWNAFLAGVAATANGGTQMTDTGWVRYRGKYAPNGGPPHYYLNTPIYSSFPNNQGVANVEMASQRGRIGRRKA